jgi:hypothetical protein
MNAAGSIATVTFARFTPKNRSMAAVRPTLAICDADMGDLNWTSVLKLGATTGVFTSKIIALKYLLEQSCLSRILK